MADKKSNTSAIIIALLLVVIAIGGYFIYQDQQTETVGISIGGKEISATIER